MTADCLSSLWTQFLEVVRAFCSKNTVPLNSRVHLILQNSLLNNVEECQITSNSHV